MPEAGQVVDVSVLKRFIEGMFGLQAGDVTDFALFVGFVDDTSGFVTTVDDLADLALTVAMILAAAVHKQDEAESVPVG